MSTLNDLAGLGEKRVGTDKGAQAGQYVKMRMIAAGLQDVIEEPFDFPRYDLQSSALMVTGVTDGGAPFQPGYDVFEASGIGHVDADVVAVGTAHPQDLAGKDLTGKIALVERDKFYHRSSQVKNVADAGAKGMIYLSVAPDNLRQVGSVRRTWEVMVSIPVVTIGAVDGAMMKDAAAANKPLHAVIDVQAASTPAVGKNILGKIQGSDPDGREIVVGAHYDTWFAGATDNGSGVAGLLAMAERRAKKGTMPAQTIVFVAYDGEEVALFGGYDFLRRHHIVGKEQISAILNLETPSARDSKTYGLAHSTIPGFDEVLRDAELNQLYTFYVSMKTVPDLFGGIIPTDIQGIYRNGVPTATTAVDSTYYHTTADTPDKVDPVFLATAVDEFDRAVDGLLQIGPTCCADVDPDLWKASVTAQARTDGQPLVVEATITDANGKAQASTSVDAILLYDDFFAAGSVKGTTDGAGHVLLTFPADQVDIGKTKRFVHVTAGADFPLVEAILAIP